MKRWKRALLSVAATLIVAATILLATHPWVGPDNTTYHIYHFIAADLESPGNPYAGIWHGKLFGADEPFLWAFAGDFQYSLNFQTMTGADVPSPPCKLVFWRSYGRP